ncbi:MAG: hypothetical protein RR324_03230 [Cellulosilyticaceae bacterium]
MFKNFLAYYEKVALSLFEYKFIIHFEEIILVFAGIFIGIFIMSLLSANFIRKLHSIEDFGESKLKMIRIDDGTHSKYIICFKNFSEAVEQVLLLSFSPFFTTKRFTMRDAKRTKRFLLLMAFLSIITIIFAILSICTVFQPIM